MFLYSTDIEQI